MPNILVKYLRCFGLLPAVYFGTTSCLISLADKAGCTRGGFGGVTADWPITLQVI